MASNSAKREAFLQRIKVNNNSRHQAASKRTQVLSNNGNKGEAAQRQRSLAGGRGHER